MLHPPFPAGTMIPAVVPPGPERPMHRRSPFGAMGGFEPRPVSMHPPVLPGALAALADTPQYEVPVTVDPERYQPKGPEQLPRPRPGAHLPLTAIVLGCEFELGGLVVRELAAQPVFEHVWALCETPMILADFGLSPKDDHRVTIISTPYDVMEEAMEPVLSCALRLVAFCCMGTAKPDGCVPVEFHRVNFNLPLRFVTKVLEGHIMRVSVLSVKDADMGGLFLSPTAKLRGIMEEAIMNLWEDDFFRTLFIRKQLEPGVVFFQAPLMITDGLQAEGEWRGLHGLDSGRVSRKELAKQRAALRFGLSAAFAMRSGNVAKAMVSEARDFVLLSDSGNPEIILEMAQMRMYAVVPEEIKALAKKAEQELEDGLGVPIADEERLIRRLDAQEYDRPEHTRFGRDSRHRRPSRETRHGRVHYDPCETRNPHLRSARGELLIVPRDAGPHPSGGRELVQRTGRSLRSQRDAEHSEDDDSVGSSHRDGDQRARQGDEDGRLQDHQRGGAARPGSGLERRKSLGVFGMGGAGRRGERSGRKNTLDRIDDADIRSLDRQLARGQGDRNGFSGQREFSGGATRNVGDLHITRRQERIDDADILLLEDERLLREESLRFHGPGGGVNEFGSLLSFDSRENMDVYPRGRMVTFGESLGGEAPRWRGSLLRDPDYQPGGQAYADIMRLKLGGVGALTVQDPLPLRTDEAVSLQERLMGTSNLRPANAAGYVGALGSRENLLLPPVPRGMFQNAYGSVGVGLPGRVDMRNREREKFHRDARLREEMSIVRGADGGGRGLLHPDELGREEPDGHVPGRAEYEQSYGQSVLRAGDEEAALNGRESMPRRRSEPRVQPRRRRRLDPAKPRSDESLLTPPLRSGEALERAMASRPERSKLPARDRPVRDRKAQDEEALYRVHLERERSRPVKNASLMAAPDSVSSSRSDEGADAMHRVPDRTSRRSGGNRGDSIRKGLWRLAERALGPPPPKDRDPIVAI